VTGGRFVNNNYKQDAFKAIPPVNEILVDLKTRKLAEHYGRPFIVVTNKPPAVPGEPKSFSLK
jgi:hypothetical protein